MRQSRVKGQRGYQLIFDVFKRIAAPGAKPKTFESFVREGQSELMAKKA